MNAYILVDFLLETRTVDWGSVDWNKPSEQIAAEMGIDADIVRRARRGQQLTRTNREAYKPLQEIDWDSVDWGRRNKDIAAELGINPAYVAMARGKLAPHTLRPFHRRID